jgi:hypothetical protein
MRRQVERLSVDARRENVTVQVIPFSRGPHPGLEGSFQLYTFPEGRLSDVVFLEGLGGQFFIDKATDVDTYRKVFGEVTERFALSPHETAAWLKEVLNELG